MSEIFSKDESEGYSPISACLSLSFSISLFKIREVPAMFLRGREGKEEGG